MYFLSISSEAGLEIDSQQEEEPVQASDESDLPSTSQDPPSSSSVGKDCAHASYIHLYQKSSSLTFHPDNWCQHSSCKMFGSLSCATYILVSSQIILIVHLSEGAA